MKPRAERPVLLFLLLPILVLPLLLGIGEEPDLPQYGFADTLSVRFDYNSTGFDPLPEGQEVSFFAKFDPIDQDRYGIAPSHPFISEGLFGMVEVALTLDGFPVDPQDPENPEAPFGCLGPIEIVNGSGETIITVLDFCSSNEIPARIRFFGDFSTGEGLGWRYNTPTGEVVVEVDAE